MEDMWSKETNHFASKLVSFKRQSKALWQQIKEAKFFSSKADILAGTEQEVLLKLSR